MTDAAPLFRARLGAALRALPSELVDATPAPSGVAVDDGSAALARALERTSPGLALMMQLRARVFDEATRTVAQRGFDQLIVLGCGFDDRRIRRAAREGVRVVEVEHRSVLAARRRRRSIAPAVTQIAVDDLARDALLALAQNGIGLHDRKTFLLLQGMSFWGGVTTLRGWLDRLACDAASGSEMLLNVVDAAVTAEACRAGADVRAPDGGAALAVSFGVERPRLRGEVEVRGLRLVRFFDSTDLQRRYLGLEDLIVREIYVWLATRVDEPARIELLLAPTTGAIRERSQVAVRWSDRPRLRRGLDVQWTGRPPAIVGWAVTALRACQVALTPEALAIASSFDGTRTLAAVAAALGGEQGPHDPEAVGTVARLLAAHGALATATAADEAYAAANGALERGDADAAVEKWRTAVAIDGDHLGAFRELAFLALRQQDRFLAAWVRRRLARLAGNRAADHLRQTLRRCGRSWPRLERRGSLAVLSTATTTAEQAGAVLADADEILTSIARLLDVPFNGHALIDISTARLGIPKTIVSDAEPYTLVGIPFPMLSRPLLCHELTHVVAMAASTWLSEGLAVWMQRRVAPGRCFPDDEPSVAAERTTRVGLAERLRPPAAASNDDTAPPLGRAEYVAAADFVDFVVRTRGWAGFKRFFVACRYPLDDERLVAACGAIGASSAAALENEWLGERP